MAVRWCSGGNISSTDSFTYSSNNDNEKGKDYYDNYDEKENDQWYYQSTASDNYNDNTNDNNGNDANHPDDDIDENIIIITILLVITIMKLMIMIITLFLHDAQFQPFTKDWVPASEVSAMKRW